MSTTRIDTHEPAADIVPSRRPTSQGRNGEAAPALTAPASRDGDPAGADRSADPARTAMSPPPAEPARPRRGNRVPLVVAVLVVAGLAGWGFQQWRFARVHVSTDNAQVQGDVIPVLPRVSGFVADIRVQENQRVRAGQTLIVLDDRDLAAKLAQSEADLAVAEAAVRASGRDGQAVAQLAAARALEADAEAVAWKANADLTRFRSLASQGVVSAQELDAAEASARGANAKLQAAHEQVQAAAAGLTSASARVVSARAARDQMALQLSYTRLVAPMSGIISRKDVQVGQLVQVGQPLMSVVPIDDVWVVANLKETEVQNVAAGQPVKIQVDSYPGRTFQGTVESLSPASGARFSLLPPDNATGNFTKVVQRIPVRIRIAGAQDPRHLLRPGMSVNVVIATA